MKITSDIAEELYKYNRALLMGGCNAMIGTHSCVYYVQPRIAEEIYHPSHYKFFYTIEDAYKYAITNPFQTENNIIDGSAKLQSDCGVD